VRRRVALRSVAVLLLGGLLLSACGTQSMASAMTSWVASSSYRANTKQLLGDASKTAGALRIAGESANKLHTVCGVLLVESEQANSALPTPDHLVNTLLSRAYGDLGAAANIGYKSADVPASHARALNYVSKGLGALAEASAQIRSDLGG
jgi:hypothetical protein